MRTNWHSSTSTSNNIASIILALSCLFLLLAPCIAHGTAKQVTSKIYATMTDERFGGCMALIDMPFELACPTNRSSQGWVTFGCTGQFGSINTANEAFRQAQLAMVGKDKLTVVVDDEQSQAGQCYAYRTIYSP